MADDAIPERNVDRVGGIIAVAAFGVCLLAHIWHMLRYRFHLYAATAIFLVLRIVGWLLAFIGAIKDDTLLNKRGYITNAVAFWLLMLGALLLIARWEASRRGAKWGVRSWGGTGAALILCVVLGALDAAGQITWLNNPDDDPKATLKVADVGFLVLAVINVIFVLFFNMRDATIYQRPTVRWAFVISSLLICARCVFWMLIGLHIIHFDQGQRRIFLFCLATIPEILVVVAWSFFPIAKYLRPQSNDGAEIEGSKPESVFQHQSTRISSLQPSNPTGIVAAHTPAENNDNNTNVVEDVVELSIPDGVTATSMGNTGARIHKNSVLTTTNSVVTDSSHGIGRISTLHNSMPSIAANTASPETEPHSYISASPQLNHPTAQGGQQPQQFNPWAGAVANMAATSTPNSPFNPKLSMYPQGTPPNMQQTQYYVPQPQQPAQMQMQQPQVGGTPMVGASSNVGTMPMPTPAVRFLTPSPSPYANTTTPHANFVKTPYPPGHMVNQPEFQIQPHVQPQLQMPPSSQIRQSQVVQAPIQTQSSPQPTSRVSQQYVQPSNPAFTDEYFKGDDSSRNIEREQQQTEKSRDLSPGVQDDSSKGRLNESNDSAVKTQLNKAQGHE
ncbi:hypothetical protein IW140_004599 [Coemansia sp. RSA 1813]|nr:hypothetical protein EV178_002168 [Coemansia sp. RSA 1646]KAJ1766040.1 hypothetical protein LPJ74_006078 [Coemansia sp. RSA 1843]KAJ2090332.1 hypothetical protein IW138_002758 [Coemansia sp. RSA 986]KAJ2215522.1 hypothetical protein EV179_002115 [Coemansia sp. RSA 487]KAJ2567174.1 hypothetical protein IW140_004599 [Coemansia sp. RSA 1813]